MKEAIESLVRALDAARVKGLTVAVCVEAKQVDCKFTVVLTPPQVGELLVPPIDGGAL